MFADVARIVHVEEREGVLDVTAIVRKEEIVEGVDFSVFFEGAFEESFIVVAVAGVYFFDFDLLFFFYKIGNLTALLLKCWQYQLILLDSSFGNVRITCEFWLHMEIS